MTLDAQLPALQIVVPMLTAPLLVLMRVRGLPWLTATAASLMAFAIAVALMLETLGGNTLSYAMGNWAPPYGIELRIDVFNALLLMVVTGASSVALLAGRASLDRDIPEGKQPLFFSAWLLAVSGLSGIAASGDAFNIFVFMEIASLASYILVAAGPDRRALTAVFKYLVMGTIGATFYLIGVGLIYMMTGTLNLADMAGRLADVSDYKPILTAAGFITVGLALKAAVFPLHAWLPNAYTFAPNMVTVFIAACSTKVSIYVLLRFDFVVFQGALANHEIRFASFLMPLALLGMLAGSAVAMFERDLKRLLAWSSVAQLGYIMLGASLVSVTGLTAAVVHIFNHALIKAALFLAVACLGMRLSGLRLDRLGGAGQAMPLTMAAFLLAALSLVGVPGTAGFISKWYLISAALEQGPLGGLLVAAILVSSLMAVAYVWRIVEAAWFQAPVADGPPLREAPAWMLAVTCAVALANLGFGLVPELPLTLAREAAAALIGASNP